MDSTPGPWKWFNDGDLASEDGHIVLRPDAERGVPTDADAALIASAPELKADLDQALWVAALAGLYVDGWGDPCDAQYFIEDWLKSLLVGR